HNRGASVSFTPTNGKAYTVLTEVKGNPIDADGAGGGECDISVRYAVNGQQNFLANNFIRQDLSTPAPPPPGNQTQNVDWGVSSAGLRDAGQTQTITAFSDSSSDCASNSSITSVRIAVARSG